MADGVTSFAPVVPFIRSVSASQKIAPSVLDLGSFNLTRNPRAEAAARLFASPSPGGLFSSVASFVAVATANNLQLSKGADTAAAKNSAYQAYSAALDLFLQRETPAEARLKELLTTSSAAPPATAPASGPALSLATNAGVTVAEGGVAIITSDDLFTAADASNNNITYNVTGGPVNGHLELSYNPGAGVVSFTQANIAAGQLRYIHNGTDTASDNFSFTVRSGASELSGSFSIAVTAANDAPQLAVNAGASVNEGASVILATSQLAASDIDTDKSHLVYNVTALPVNGRLELTTHPGTAITSFTQAEVDSGRVRYVHNGSETTSDSFTFSLSDGTTTLAAAAFNITVNPVNDTPSLTNAGTTVTEGSVVTLTTSDLNATDPESPDSGLVFTVTSSPSNGYLQLEGDPGVAITSFTQADLAAGTVQYVHNGSEGPTDSFTFSLSDGANTLTGNAFNITVNPVDDAPVLAANTGTSLNEGATTIITASQLGATDVDTSNANLVFSVASGPANGQLELSTSAGVAITSFTQADVAAGIVQYVHNGSETAADSFTFTLQDQTTSLGAATFNVNVNPVDDTPQLTNTGATVTEGASAIITTSQLGATDPDTSDSNLVYTVTSATANGSLEFTSNPGVSITSFTQADLAAGAVQYVHNGSETTADSFTFSLSDGTGTLAGNTFNISVTPADDAPVLTANTGTTVNEGATTILTTSQLNAADVDTPDADLVYTVTGAPAHGQLELSTDPGLAITSFTQAALAAGIVQYAHDGSETTTDSFTFTLGDQTTTLSAAAFGIAVTPVDDAPLLTNTGVTLNEGASAVIGTSQLGAADVDTSNSNLIYTVTSAPANGRLELTTNAGVAITSFTQTDLAAGVVRYVHSGSETTSDSFSFSLSDGTNTLSGNTFNITVNPVDDAPVLATNTGVTANEGAAASITTSQLNVTDADTANFNVIYTITAAPAHGQLEYVTSPGTAITSFTQADLQAGLVQYVHDGSETTSDSFTFTAKDQTTTLAAATFNISVSPVDDAPVVAVNSGATVNEGSSTILTTAKLNATDADTSTANLVYTVTSAPTNGRLELTTNAGVAITSFTQADLAAGIVRYVNNGSETTSDSFAFTLKDQTTTLSASTFNITVNPVDDAPVLATNTGTTVSRVAGSTVITTSQLNATDVDTSTPNITFTVTGGLTKGHLELTTNPGTTVTSFTEADLIAGRVKYVLTGFGLAPDSFTFTVQDATTTLAASTFNITVTL